jgi:sugar/nucleoside kinase (ribokinase family)
VLGGRDVVATLATGVTVVKQGPEPAWVLPRGGEPVAVPVPDGGPVRDTTGAGDAFAAGFLVALSGGAAANAAALAGHATARLAIDRVSGAA